MTTQMTTQMTTHLRHPHRPWPRLPAGWPRRIGLLLLALSLVTVSACARAQEDTAVAGGQGDGDGGRLDLTGVCPDPIVVQSAWFSQVEHFLLFQLLGQRYTPDAERKAVTGPLVAHGGVDTGVDIEIRAGGPAVGFQQVSALMYQDDSIHLGMLHTDEAIQNSKDQPVTAVIAPYDSDPLVLLWSPEVHPEFNVIADIGQTDTTVLYFEGTGTYMSYLLGSGILRESQVDGSNDGSPARFVAEGGQIAVVGFSTSEPYRWANEVDAWDRPIDYAYISDTGYPRHANTLAVRTGDLEDLAPCLEQLVPILQQAMVDFLADPQPVIELILKIVDETEQGYVDSAERSRHAVEVMVTDGLVSNGADETVGDFDLDNVRELYDIVEPIFAGQGIEIAEGLEPEDVATNRFIDEGIGLPPPAALTPTPTATPAAARIS